MMGRTLLVKKQGENIPGRRHWLSLEELQRRSRQLEQEQTGAVRETIPQRGVGRQAEEPGLGPYGNGELQEVWGQEASWSVCDFQGRLWIQSGEWIARAGKRGEWRQNQALLLISPGCLSTLRRQGQESTLSAFPSVPTT